MKNWMTGVAVAGGMLGVVVAIGLMATVGSQPEFETPSSAAAEADAAAMDAAAYGSGAGETVEVRPSTPERFTKAEFANYVYGKTKAEVRREFGSPAHVDDATDSWWYSMEDITIYDAEAGTRTSVTIRFMGLPGPENEVATVTF